MTFHSKPKFPKVKPAVPTIDSLYPDFTANEKAEAEDTLKRYVAIVWRIFQRLRREREEKKAKP